jgi:predicted nucleic-acid-binding protein
VQAIVKHIEDAINNAGNVVLDATQQHFWHDVHMKGLLEILKVEGAAIKGIFVTKEELEKLVVVCMGPGCGRSYEVTVHLKDGQVFKALTRYSWDQQWSISVWDAKGNLVGERSNRDGEIKFEAAREALIKKVDAAIAEDAAAIEKLKKALAEAEAQADAQIAGAKEEIEALLAALNALVKNLEGIQGEAGLSDATREAIEAYLSGKGNVKDLIAAVPAQAEIYYRTLHGSLTAQIKADISSYDTHIKALKDHGVKAGAAGDPKTLKELQTLPERMQIALAMIDPESVNPLPNMKDKEKEGNDLLAQANAEIRQTEVEKKRAEILGKIAQEEKLADGKIKDTEAAIAQLKANLAAQLEALEKDVAAGRKILEEQQAVMKELLSKVGLSEDTRKGLETQISDMDFYLQRAGGLDQAVNGYIAAVQFNTNAAIVNQNSVLASYVAYKEALVKHRAEVKDAKTLPELTKLAVLPPYQEPVFTSSAYMREDDPRDSIEANKKANAALIQKAEEETASFEKSKEALLKTVDQAIAEDAAAIEKLKKALAEAEAQADAQIAGAKEEIEALLAALNALVKNLEGIQGEAGLSDATREAIEAYLSGKGNVKDLIAAVPAQAEIYYRTLHGSLTAQIKADISSYDTHIKALKDHGVKAGAAGDPKTLKELQTLPERMQIALAMIDPESVNPLPNMKDKEKEGNDLLAQANAEIRQTEVEKKRAEILGKIAQEEKLADGKIKDTEAAIAQLKANLAAQLEALEKDVAAGRKILEEQQAVMKELLSKVGLSEDTRKGLETQISDMDFYLQRAGGLDQAVNGYIAAVQFNTNAAIVNQNSVLASYVAYKEALVKHRAEVKDAKTLPELTKLAVLPPYQEPVFTSSAYMREDDPRDSIEANKKANAALIQKAEGEPGEGDPQTQHLLEVIAKSLNVNVSDITSLRTIGLPAPPNVGNAVRLGADVEVGKQHFAVILGGSTTSLGGKDSGSLYILYDVAKIFKIPAAPGITIETIRDIAAELKALDPSIHLAHISDIDFEDQSGTLDCIAECYLYKLNVTVSERNFTGTSFTNGDRKFRVHLEEELPEQSPAEMLIEKMQQIFIDKVGQPIEGFTPGMYKQVLPGLVDADFDGAKAAQGVYRMVEGVLKFIFEGGNFRHSGAEALTQEGMLHAVNRIVSRLEMPLNDAADAAAILAQLRKAPPVQTPFMAFKPVIKPIADQKEGQVVEIAFSEHPDTVVNWVKVWQLPPDGTKGPEVLVHQGFPGSSPETIGAAVLKAGSYRVEVANANGPQVENAVLSAWSDSVIFDIVDTGTTPDPVDPALQNRLILETNTRIRQLVFQKMQQQVMANLIQQAMDALIAGYEDQISGNTADLTELMDELASIDGSRLNPELAADIEAFLKKTKDFLDPENPKGVEPLTEKFLQALRDAVSKPLQALLDAIDKEIKLLNEYAAKVQAAKTNTELKDLEKNPVQPQIPEQPVIENPQQYNPVKALRQAIKEAKALLKKAKDEAGDEKPRTPIAAIAKHHQIKEAQIKNVKFTADKCTNSIPPSCYGPVTYDLEFPQLDGSVRVERHCVTRSGQARFVRMMR